MIILIERYFDQKMNRNRDYQVVISKIHSISSPHIHIQYWFDNITIFIYVLINFKYALKESSPHYPTINV